MLIFDADGLIKLNRSGVLGLVTRNYGSLVPAAVYDAEIVSDDRRFLGVLSDLSISFLVPSHIILGLVRDELLSVPNSKIAMNAPRPFIRQSDYLEALEELGE